MLNESSFRQDGFSYNCNQELKGHSSCVKTFLQESAKYGVSFYKPGDPATDQCLLTRRLYTRCMAQRKKNPVSHNQVMANEMVKSKPPVCLAELGIHGNCVEEELKRTRTFSEKYWAEGGPDRCQSSRDSYLRCMKQAKEDET